MLKTAGIWILIALVGVLLVATAGNSKVRGLFELLMEKSRSPKPDPLPPEPTPVKSPDVVTPAEKGVSDVKKSVNAMDDDALAAAITKKYSSGTHT